MTNKAELKQSVNRFFVDHFTIRKSCTNIIHTMRYVQFNISVLFVKKIGSNGMIWSVWNMKERRAKSIENKNPEKLMKLLNIYLKVWISSILLCIFHYWKCSSIEKIKIQYFTTEMSLNYNFSFWNINKIALLHNANASNINIFHYFCIFTFFQYFWFTGFNVTILSNRIFDSVHMFLSLYTFHIW